MQRQKATQSGRLRRWVGGGKVTRKLKDESDFEWVPRQFPFLKSFFSNLPPSSFSPSSPSPSLHPPPHPPSSCFSFFLGFMFCHHVCVGFGESFDLRCLMFSLLVRGTLDRPSLVKAERFVLTSAQRELVLMRRLSTLPRKPGDSTRKLSTGRPLAIYIFNQNGQLRCFPID